MAHVEHSNTRRHLFNGEGTIGIGYRPQLAPGQINGGICYCSFILGIHHSTRDFISLGEGRHAAQQDKGCY